MPKGVRIGFGLLRGVTCCPSELLCMVAVTPSTGGWRPRVLKKEPDKKHMTCV